MNCWIQCTGYVLFSSRKHPYSPHRRDWNFLGDGGFCKAKKLKRMYEAWLNFPDGLGGGGFSETLPWGRYGYFLELHITC